MRGLGKKDAFEGGGGLIPPMYTMYDEDIQTQRLDKVAADNKKNHQISSQQHQMAAKNAPLVTTKLL